METSSSQNIVNLMSGNIDDLRAQVDSIDIEILRLLNERAECAIQLAKLKHILELPLHDTAREHEILARLCSANNGPLDNRAICKILRRIIHECLCFQANIIKASASSS